MLQIVQPKVRSRDLLQPANTNKCHVPNFKSHSNTDPLNQNVSKQRKENYEKITEIPASLAFLVLPMEQ